MDCRSKAALYIRVSTEEQALEGQSVDAQIETLTQYCRLYGIDIYDIYKDLGISGKETRNRPGLKRMLADASQKRFQLVLVWKISRLTRSLKDLLLILDELEDYDIAFTSYSEKFDTTTPVGKMTLQLLGSIAEFERNTIVDNVKLGLKEYARKGGKTGCVLGYDNKNKQLVVNPKEAEIVKLIFKLYTVNRLSLAYIAEHLNSYGYKTKRSNRFNKDSVAVILSNPVYIGINRHHIGSADEYETPGSHQPIIDMSTWKTAQLLREANKKSKLSKTAAPAFLLSGKIRCHCGSLMYGFTSGSRNKTYRYYRCKACGSICKAEPIEEAVIKDIKGLLESKRISQDVLMLANSSNDDSLTHMKAMEAEREYNRLLKLLDKYISLMGNENLSSSKILAERVKELDDKLAALEREKSRFLEHASHTACLLTITDYQNRIEDLFNQRSKALKKLIHLCIKLVYMNEDKTIHSIVHLFQLKEN